MFNTYLRIAYAINVVEQNEQDTDWAPFCTISVCNELVKEMQEYMLLVRNIYKKGLGLLKIFVKIVIGQ